MKQQHKRILLLVPLLTVFYFTVLNSIAEATPLHASLSNRVAFSLGNLDLNSYDGPGYNAFLPYQAFTSGELLQVSSFTGSPLGGSKMQFFTMSEVAYYDGHIPGLVDSFGVLDSQGHFTSALSAASGIGATSELIQGVNDELTFAIRSPEGTFSSIDGNNPDQAAHIVAMEVTKAGQINISNANLLGAFHSFNLQIGDIVLFLEDLRAGRNILKNGLPSDFDYNDMVVVVRSQAIPEPATVVLLSAGLFAFARRRRGRRSAS